LGDSVKAFPESHRQLQSRRKVSAFIPNGEKLVRRIFLIFDTEEGSTADSFQRQLAKSALD